MTDLIITKCGFPGIDDFLLLNSNITSYYLQHVKLKQYSMNNQRISSMIEHYCDTNLISLPLGLVADWDITSIMKNCLMKSETM